MSSQKTLEVDAGGCGCVQPMHTETLGACRELLKDEDWFARKTAVDTLKKAPTAIKRVSGHHGSSCFFSQLLFKAIARVGLAAPMSAVISAISKYSKELGSALQVREFDSVQMPTTEMLWWSWI